MSGLRDVEEHEDQAQHIAIIWFSRLLKASFVIHHMLDRYQLQLVSMISKVSLHLRLLSALLWPKLFMAKSVSPNESGTLSVSTTRTISRLSLCSAEPISCNFIIFDIRSTYSLAVEKAPHAALLQLRHCDLSRICNIMYAGVWACFYTLNNIKERSRASLSRRQSLSCSIGRIGWTNPATPTAATHAKVRRFATDQQRTHSFQLPKAHVENAILSQLR